MKKHSLPILAITLAAITLSTTEFSAAQATPAPQAPVTQSTPAAQPNSINGKWHFVFDTEGGDREFEAEFTVDADGNITGTWGKDPATGTFKDGHLLMTFETTAEELNETAPLHLDGKFDDPATLTGSWTFSEYQGTFKATHPTP